jgi:hypothetical protein
VATAANAAIANANATASTAAIATIAAAVAAATTAALQFLLILSEIAVTFKATLLLL